VVAGASNRAGRVAAAAAIAALATILALLIGRAPAPAEAQESSEPPRPSGEVTVKASAERFFVSGGEVVAEGPSTATFRGEDGSTYSLDQRLRLQVDTTNNCRLLELHLAELYLDLLGLQVRTSTINAKLTGDRKQALGKLFCKLSDALKLSKEALAKRVARSLNRNLGDRGLPVLQFTATVHGQEQGTGSTARQGQAPPPPPDACPVLDILLGPLDLDLLGLVLELYGPTEGDPIRVNVVADPNGGELGRTFCGLSGQ
jgi:hypothetical protein